MVPIGDAPAVAHATRRLRRAGIEMMVVNVHHRPREVGDWARREGVRVSAETELLGTAGGLAHARKLLGDGDVVVWNGDMVGEVGMEQLLAAHADTQQLATLAVAPRACGEGNVGIGEDGRVVRLRGVRYGVEARGGDFLGIHVSSGEGRALLPERGCLVGDAWIPALAKGGVLRAFETEAKLRDVGTLEAYVASNRAWLVARGKSEWAAESALIRAPIDGSIVGDGARIDAKTLRCIVWPGTCVVHPIEDAIVTPYGSCSIPTVNDMGAGSL
jgi:mannose-1-phosphate guanylyltransferase